MMTVCDSMDSDKQPVLGISDDRGRISCSDQSRFPFLYAKGPQPLIDENGLVVGEVDFSDNVAFTLIDTETAERVVVEAVVRPELNIITLVWDDGLAAAPKSLQLFPDAAGLDAPQAQPPAEWFLDQNYPNPFD